MVRTMEVARRDIMQAGTSKVRTTISTFGLVFEPTMKTE